MAAAQPPLQLNVSGLGAASQALLAAALTRDPQIQILFLIIAGILGLALCRNVAEETT